MSTREELEASLRAHWDLETLAVYADFLQAQGEARGELISLDLDGASQSARLGFAGARSTSEGSAQSIDVEKRRGQLLSRWLGEGWLGEDFEVSWDPRQRIWYVGDLETSYATFDCGFVELCIYDADYSMDLVVAHLLAAPAGEYLRRLTLRGPTAMLELMLEVVSSRRRTWLQHLALARPLHETPLLVPPPLAAKLVAATPNLEVLDVKGRNVLGGFTHPNLRELGVTGTEAIDLVDGPPLPALHTIDFALEEDRPTPRGLFGPARVPALRRLHVAREEARAEIFALLGTLAVAPQLTHLVLPSLREAREVALAQAAIDRMPVLREVTIARAYAHSSLLPGLRHPHARIRVPEPWPWYPPDAYRYRPLSIDGLTTDLGAVVDVLEEQFDELPDDVRAIWNRVWMAIDALGRTHEQAVHAGDLARALEALVLSPDLEGLRDELRRRLAKRGPYFAAVSWAR